MTYEFKQTRRIEFADTDMGGIMHFANFFRFMEMTEHAFYRSLGLRIHGEVGFPRVAASCEYSAPLRFDDEVEIQLLVSEKREKSLSFELVFRKIEDGGKSEVARGTMVAVSAAYDAGERRMKAVPLPPEFADKIQAAPPGLLSKKKE